MKEDQTVIKLHDRIDSDNAGAAESEIVRQLPENADAKIVLDAQDLRYISSAGLRVLLHIRKSFPNIRVINVSPEIYGIFDMTGFTEMFKVEKAYRRISVEGCEMVDSGATGSLYRIDRDNIVKVFNTDNDLEEILHEREMARIALILGIPTAISYDVVLVGDNYGSVFEMLDATTFSRILADDPGKLSWCVDESVKLLRQIHDTKVPAGKLPDVRIEMAGKVDALRDHLPEEVCDKLKAMIEAVPFSDHMIHGDYHTKNLMLMKDEVLIIDMETLSTGHPVFEFSKMFNAYIGFSEVDHEQIKRFQGFDYELSRSLWRRSVEAYFETDDQAYLREIEGKSALIGYVRILHFIVGRGHNGSEYNRKLYEHCRKRIIDLIGQYDSVEFEVKRTGSEI